MPPLLPPRHALPCPLVPVAWHPSACSHYCMWQSAAQRFGAIWRIMLSTNRFENTCMPKVLSPAPLLPCAKRWGNFDHVGCRGDTTEAKDVLGGSGFVTNVHITDRLVQVGGQKGEKRGKRGRRKREGKGRTKWHRNGSHTNPLLQGTLKQVAQGLCPLSHLKEFDVGE